jgi:hypothetical protein
MARTPLALYIGFTPDEVADLTVKSTLIIAMKDAV